MISSRANVIFVTIAAAALAIVFTCFLPPPEGTIEPPPGSADQMPAEKIERDENLQRLADELLYLFDAMPAVPVHLKDQPIVRNGSNTERGVAYTACEKHENPSIFIKKEFYANANRRQLVNILKHELTHAYLCRKGRMWGHDEEFRRKFREVGGFGN